MRWRLRSPGGERSPVREAATRYVAIGLVAVALISIVASWESIDFTEAARVSVRAAIGHRS